MPGQGRPQKSKPKQQNQQNRRPNPKGRQGQRVDLSTITQSQAQAIIQQGEAAEKKAAKIFEDKLNATKNKSRVQRNLAYKAKGPGYEVFGPIHTILETTKFISKYAVNSVCGFAIRDGKIHTLATVTFQFDLPDVCADVYGAVTRFEPSYIFSKDVIPGPLLSRAERIVSALHKTDPLLNFSEAFNQTLKALISGTFESESLSSVQISDTTAIDPAVSKALYDAINSRKEVGKNPLPGVVSGFSGYQGDLSLVEAKKLLNERIEVDDTLQMMNEMTFPPDSEASTLTEAQKEKTLALINAATSKINQQRAGSVVSQTFSASSNSKSAFKVGDSSYDAAGNKTN